MSQLVVTLIFILVSSILLATENKTPSKDQSHIKCEMIGLEHKVYVFDIHSNKYKMSLLEKGQQKTSLTRNIQQLKEPVSYPNYREYQFGIDDHSQVQVKINQRTGEGRGELIQKGFPTRVKSFSKCEIVK